MKFFYIIVVCFSMCAIYVNAQERPPCPGILCLATNCAKCEIPVFFRGECCPVCREVPGTNATYLTPPSANCSRTSCPISQCTEDEEALAEPNKCCPTVCVAKHPRTINCALVFCAAPKCTDGEIPVRFRGQCCHQCLKVPGTKAASLNPPPDCPFLNCKAGYEPLAVSGACCASVCVARPCKRRN